jgi:hypothetical protein
MHIVTFLFIFLKTINIHILGTSLKDYDITAIFTMVVVQVDASPKLPMHTTLGIRDNNINISISRS